VLWWLYRRGPSAAPRWLKRIPGVDPLLRAMKLARPDIVESPSLIAQAGILEGAIFLLDAATLAAMLAAVGHPAPFDAVFAAFVFASIAQLLGIVPGGLGTFEGAQVALLTLLRVPLEAALTATLLLRGFTFWLPLLPGMWVAHREMAHRDSPART
jgi:uncharacterized membrane protein YbhN (UPF0104 family)